MHYSVAGTALSHLLLSVRQRHQTLIKATYSSLNFEICLYYSDSVEERERTLLYPDDRDDRVKFMCDHMETTPGDSSDWEDRNVSQYVLFRDQNFLFSLTLSKWRRAEIISVPPYSWKKSKNMKKLCKDYKNKFFRLNCWKKIRENFEVTPDEAEKK